MSAKFCLFIPSKIIQIDKYFAQKLKTQITEYKSREFIESDFYNYSFLKFQDLISQSDVNSDLPEKMYNRYYVIDWGFCFPPSNILKDFLGWLSKIYPYGEVGLLKYWSDTKKRFPPIKIAESETKIFDFSVDNLPLDHVLFFPLKQFNETN